MSKLQSTPIAVLTAVALAATIGFAVQYTSMRQEPVKIATATGSGVGSDPAAASGAAAATGARPVAAWAASAPGRIEPKGGEVRVSAAVPGRITEVLVQMNDKLSAGDIMLRLDDDEAQAKLVAADAEAAVRRRERDAETVGRLAQDRRNAEDAVAAAERALFQARRDADRAVAGRRASTISDDDVAKARAAVTAARDKLEQEREALRKVQASSGMPLPTRLESSLATARSELSQVETAIERTRVRAPINGTALQVAARVGEFATPSPEQPLVVLGDMSNLRVRAEVEERDVSKIKSGQRVVVRTDAFPGRDFKGTVAAIGQSLAPPRLPSRGPRRPTDVDALEVTIDLEAGSPLLPGMRTDVYFELPAPAQAAAAAKTN